MLSMSIFGLSAMAAADTVLRIELMWWLGMNTCLMHLCFGRVVVRYP